MATKDGKTFGMFELEWVYDFMAAHRDFTFEQVLAHTRKQFPELTIAEATAYVVAMRKERRKLLTLRLTENSAAGEGSMAHWAMFMAKNAGTFIRYNDLVKSFMDHWHCDGVTAERFVDNAIFNLPDPERRFVQFDNFEAMARALQGRIVSVDTSELQQKQRDACLHMTKAVEEVANIKTTWEPAMDDQVRFAHRTKEPRPEPFEGIFLDRLDNAEKMLLKIIQEGEIARDSGASTPYRGNTLAHCLHAFGWVHRDLQLALEKATEGHYTARKLSFDAKEGPKPTAMQYAEVYRSNDMERVPGSHPEVSASVDLEEFEVGNFVTKYKGYRFPSQVVAKFTTRKGKVRYVAEGIADGNDECLHIFGASDLQRYVVEFGWVYSGDGYWWHSDEYPTGPYDRGSERPATAAEYQFIRALAEGTPKPLGDREGQL